VAMGAITVGALGAAAAYRSGVQVVRTTSGHSGR